MSDRLLARRTAAWMVASLCLATFLALGPASGIALAWQDAPKTDPSAAAGGSAPAPGGGGDAAAQAHGRAVDRRDQRNLQIIEAADDPVDDAAIADANLRA